MEGGKLKTAEKKFGRFLMYLPFIWYIFWVFYNFAFTPYFHNIDVNPFSMIYLIFVILIDPITIILLVIGLIGYFIQRR